MAKSKSSALKNVFVLLGVTIIAVTLLAVINQITLQPIADADALARAEVYQKVYTDAADIKDIDNFDKLVKDFDLIKSTAGSTINAALEAKDENGNVIGYVIDSTSKSGYGGDVQIAVGITNEGEITAFSVVAHSETPGLGSRATEPEFADQFKGMPAQMVEFSQTGKTKENEIDAISGATYTTNAVTEAVNEAIAFYNNMLKGE